jgi:hypothetical protein
VNLLIRRREFGHFFLYVQVPHGCLDRRFHVWRIHGLDNNDVLVAVAGADAALADVLLSKTAVAANGRYRHGCFPFVRRLDAGLGLDRRSDRLGAALALQALGLANFAVAEPVFNVEQALNHFPATNTEAAAGCSSVATQFAFHTDLHSLDPTSLGRIAVCCIR